MARIFWSARDLSSKLSMGLGNHHFLLVELEGTESLRTTINIKQGNRRFATLAAIRRYETNKKYNLVFQENDTDDVKSVQEVNNPALRRWWKPDYDLEKHEIKPPTAGGWAFATKIEQLALNYRKHTKTSPVEYKLFSDNCAAWVNTILKVAGVSKAVRKKHCNFSGIDAGHEHLLNENLFSS